MRIKLYPVIIVIAMFLGGTVYSSPMNEEGTILLVSGESFENVVYQVDNELRVITILIGDSKRKVLFSDVRSIHTSDGVDLSENILGIKRRSTPVEKIPSELAPISSGGPWQATGKTWQSNDSEAHKKARAKDWHVSLTLNLGFDAPAGEMYDFISGGVGYGGDIRFALTNHVALIGTASLTGLNLDQSSFIVLTPPNISLISQNFSLNAVRVLAGLEYYNSLGRHGLKRMWYFHTLAGVIRHDFLTESVLRNNSTGSEIIITFSQNNTQFTTTFGGGIVPKLTKRIGINLSGDLDLVWAQIDNGNSTSSGVKGIVFNVHTGLMFFL